LAKVIIPQIARLRQSGPAKKIDKITKENLDKKTSFGAGNVDFG
jgi:hypothetical protein